MTELTLAGTRVLPGVGDPMVLLNAFPLDRAQWEPLIAACAARRQAAGQGSGQSSIAAPVIAFDMPGIGATPLPDTAPSLELIADAAVASLAEFGAQRATWIGCSMGGYVLLAIAERHPSVIGGVALLNTRSTADGDEARERRLTIARDVETLASAPNPRAMAESLVGLEGPEREALLSSVTANIARHSGAGIAWGQRVMAARPDRTSALRSLRSREIPAVVITGERDTLTNRDDAAHLGEALGVEPVVIPGVGHLSALEAPERVATALRALPGVAP